MTTFETTHEWESDEFENYEGENYESEAEFAGAAPLSETLEMELAGQLLEITSEAELEQFIGKLVRGAAKAVGGFVKSPVGRALGGALKQVAKKALPIAGGALGNFVLPGVGGAIGSKLGSMASNLFELELENMGEQEAEFEIARRYVRFAAAAAQNAARSRGGSPGQVARSALTSAARRHAPGLVGGSRRRGRPQRRPNFYYGGGGGAVYQDQDDDSPWDEDGDTNGEARSHSGRWVRRGRKIVIIGA